MYGRRCRVASFSFYRGISFTTSPMHYGCVSWSVLLDWSLPFYSGRCSTYSSSLCSLNILLVVVHKGALQLEFPSFRFTSHILAYFPPFVAVRLVSFLSLSCFLSIYYSMSTPPMTQSCVAPCDMRDDPPFSVGRYIDDFPERPAARWITGRRLLGRHRRFGMCVIGVNVIQPWVRGRNVDSIGIVTMCWSWIAIY